MRTGKEAQLLEKLEIAAREHGYALVDVERTGSGRNALVRVYLDRLDTDQGKEGLTLDDIAAANTWVAEVVEVLDPYKGSYTLEVSSPGIDRPLRTKEHFARAVGEEAAITLEGLSPAENGEKEEAKPRLKYTGTITGFDPAEELVSLEVDGTVFDLKLANIKKARVKGRVSFEGSKTS